MWLGLHKELLRLAPSESNQFFMFANYCGCCISYLMSICYVLILIVVGVFLIFIFISICLVFWTFWYNTRFLKICGYHGHGIFILNFVYFGGKKNHHNHRHFQRKHGQWKEKNTRFKWFSKSSTFIIDKSFIFFH